MKIADWPSFGAIYGVGDHYNRIAQGAMRWPIPDASAVTGSDDPLTKSLMTTDWSTT
jgi:hypothetical protein